MISMRRRPRARVASCNVCAIIEPGVSASCRPKTVIGLERIGDVVYYVASGAAGVTLRGFHCRIVPLPPAGLIKDAEKVFLLAVEACDVPRAACCRRPSPASPRETSRIAT